MVIAEELGCEAARRETLADAVALCDTDDIVNTEEAICEPPRILHLPLRCRVVGGAIQHQT